MLYLPADVWTLIFLPGSYSAQPTSVSRGFPQPLTVLGRLRRVCRAWRYLLHEHRIFWQLYCQFYCSSTAVADPRSLLEQYWPEQTLVNAARLNCEIPALRMLQQAQLDLILPLASTDHPLIQARIAQLLLARTFCRALRTALLQLEAPAARVKALVELFGLHSVKVEIGHLPRDLANIRANRGDNLSSDHRSIIPAELLLKYDASAHLPLWSFQRQRLYEIYFLALAYPAAQRIRETIRRYPPTTAGETRDFLLAYHQHGQRRTDHFATMAVPEEMLTTALYNLCEEDCFPQLMADLRPLIRQQPAWLEHLNLYLHEYIAKRKPA